jgi:hypothetical protein
MSNPPPQELDTNRVALWRLVEFDNLNYFQSSMWLSSRIKAVEDVRLTLSHLQENVDWFIVQTGWVDLDIFFTDARQAVLFKLSHVL